MLQRKPLAAVGLCVAWITALVVVPAWAQQIDIVNNQPFDIHMPVQVRGVKLTDSATAAQQVGDDAVIVMSAPAGAKVQAPLEIPPNVRMRSRVELKPDANAVRIAFDGKDRGELAWGVIVRPIDPNGPQTQMKALDTKGDFAAGFSPLPLSFRKTGEGPVFETWSASASGSGLKLDVELRAYRAGFLDVSARYTNESAPTEDVYAAVICRWQQPSIHARTLCYDNRTSDFTGQAYSPFRHGQGRHLYFQRGVDWINTSFTAAGASPGSSALWLKDFTPSFTVHREKTDKVGPRWIGANTAQVAQEAQAKGDTIYSISEIARPNLRQHLSRLDHNVLPPPGEGLLIGSRMIFSGVPISEERADQHFIAYTGYNAQEKTSDGAKVSFGVPFTRFGTNYFPYSTLGENFVTLKQPGMSKDYYWPLAPETVKQYKRFADDIKRDLRIAKAMGFELIRLHHVELLWDNDADGKAYLTEQQRNDYLDFYFGELKNLGLKALLDIKTSPEETAKFVKRYRDLIDGVEIDNEILIFQIFDADVQYWKDVYKAIKEVAPDMPVHLTAHTNTGAFDRLNALGVPFDRVGAHAYMDSLDNINSGRNFGLAVADYATTVNKPPVITEWNWRFLTRMTPEARAEIYRPIFENILKTRAIADVYQFQFQDGLAMSPTTLKGIRHYELLNLSRRPKPEAMVMMELIQAYSNPAGATRLIGINRPVVELKDGGGVAEFTITNNSDNPLKCSARPEAAAGIVASMAHSPRVTLLLELEPGESKTYPMAISLPDDAKPGFYHVFLRIECGDGSRYGWAEARYAGAPKMDAQTSTEVAYESNALDFDFNRPIAVVYPVEASVMELEAAWVIYQTLESATGRVVDIFQANDLPDDVKKRGGIIYVSKGKADKPTIRLAPGSNEQGEQLIVTGKTQEDVTQAAMDLTLRYWKTAKDSGAAKIGLVAETTGTGGVKTDLD
ncbi:MAG TPA: hypothetical protein VGR35_06345 [Tepidisphaeraceae bacterium]|nr:hypothetical protein [Tepidisphaeraceae bacterium]